MSHIRGRQKRPHGEDDVGGRVLSWVMGYGVYDLSAIHFLLFLSYERQRGAFFTPSTYHTVTCFPWFSDAQIRQKTARSHAHRWTSTSRLWLGLGCPQHSRKHVYQGRKYPQKSFYGQTFEDNRPSEGLHNGWRPIRHLGKTQVASTLDPAPWMQPRSPLDATPAKEVQKDYVPLAPATPRSSGLPNSPSKNGSSTPFNHEQSIVSWINKP